MAFDTLIKFLFYSILFYSIIIIIIITIIAKILRGGFQSPRGGFQEGPLKHKSLLKNIHPRLTVSVPDYGSRLKIFFISFLHQIAEIREFVHFISIDFRYFLTF